MEKLTILNEFFKAIEKDGRISITHIGVYASILQFWQLNGFPSPIVAFSQQIMDIAKISGMTYRKCIKDLDAYGYLKYVPSFKRNKASEIYIEI